MEDRNFNLDDVDINFDIQYERTTRQVLRKYRNAIESLRQIAEQKYNIPSYQFYNYVLVKYFEQSNACDDSGNSGRVEGPQEPMLTSLLKCELLKHIRNRRRQIVYWFSYLVIATILYMVYRDALQNRDLAYPSMRLWRRLTLPLIKRFPHLTEYYDESCLMGNPFFQVEDVNCELCASVDSVLELGENDENDDDEAINSAVTKFVPALFKIKQNNVKMEDFFRIYNKNQEAFRRDAFRVQSTNPNINNLEDLFYQFNSSNDDDAFLKSNSKMQMHSLWRCNRMVPARLFRPLFATSSSSSSSSSRLPKTGVALERFLSFDTPNAPTYYLPNTECDNAYVQQLRGSRFIMFRPTSECRAKCRTLSVRLPQSYVLRYNGLYWKPISAPDPVAETSSISLIGSYC